MFFFEIERHMNLQPRKIFFFFTKVETAFLSENVTVIYILTPEDHVFTSECILSARCQQKLVSFLEHLKQE